MERHQGGEKTRLLFPVRKKEWNGFGVKYETPIMALASRHGHETPIDKLVQPIVTAVGEVPDTPYIFLNIRSSISYRCMACITVRSRKLSHFLRWQSFSFFVIISYFVL